MTTLPDSDATLCVRTHFGDDAVWENICKAIHEPAGEYAAEMETFSTLNAMLGQHFDDEEAPDFVTIVDEPAFADLSPNEIIERLPSDADHAIVLIADEQTVAGADHPILIVDLIDEEGRTFRAIPSQIQIIEGNLSLANCDWEDFADHVDDDGVFRGHGG